MEIDELELAGLASPDDDLKRYEALILKKEQLEKDAGRYYVEYGRVFGDLIAADYEIRIACIALKKEIGLFIEEMNHGQQVDPNKIRTTLKKQMAVYQKHLEGLLKENKRLKKLPCISAYEAAQIKMLYRKLAKMLHPDISPLAGKYPVLSLVFQRVTDAYKCNDLKGLQKMEVIVSRALADLRMEDFTMEIPDLAERICEIEKEIDSIVNSTPYVYKYLVEDEAACAQKKQELEASTKEYTCYRDQLRGQLDEVKRKACKQGMLMLLAKQKGKG